MSLHGVAQHGGPDPLLRTTLRIPSRKLEVGFYIAMFYSLTSDVWGISAPLGAGALMLGIAGLCIRELRSCAKAVYTPIGLLFACAITYILIQIAVHGESVTGDAIRSFIIWILQLIIVQSLCLRRGFSHRYPLVLFLLAVSSLQSIDFSPGQVERARVEREFSAAGLSNSNGLGEWFGFFAIYFATCGLEAKRFIYRSGAWILAVGSLLVVGLTVSRGSMIGAALGIVIALRRVLKRGFLPVFVLVTLVGVVYERGLFEQIFTSYQERATAETGREKIWPAVIERIFESPIVGVGASDVGVSLDGPYPLQPHNSFLYLALSAGILPVTLFIAFFVQAGWRSAVHAKNSQNDFFRLPYLVFTLVQEMVGDLKCMSPWAVLALSIAAGSAAVYRKQHLRGTRVGIKVRLGRFSGHKALNAETVVRS